jgi:hypothetical protein
VALGPSSNAWGLLFSDTEKHSLECGGPFDMAPATDSLVSPSKCVTVAEVDLSILDLFRPKAGDRIHVAQPITCGHDCGALGPTETIAPFLHLTIGQRIQVAGC